MNGSSITPRCRFPVKVAAASSADSVQGWLGDALKVRVSVAPERGKANAAVIEVVARALGLPRRAIRIASGHTSSWKTIEIEGMTEDEVRRRLG